jgi:hypothetical protein
MAGEDSIDDFVWHCLNGGRNQKDSGWIRRQPDALEERSPLTE